MKGRREMKIKKQFALIILAIFVFSISLFNPIKAFAARSLTGTMTGVVLNSAGKVVPNTTVYVFQKQWENTDGFGTPCWTKYIDKKVTGKNGQYKFSLPAGEYRVWFVPNDLNTYAMEAYPDAAYIAIGDTVGVKSGQTTSRISVTLDSPGVISGNILDTAPDNENYGKPMAYIPIAACVQDLNIINCLEFTQTDSNGYYEIKGFKAFPWQIWINIPFIGEYGAEPSPAPGYNSNYKSFNIFAYDRYTWLPMPGTNGNIGDTYLEYNAFPNVRGRVVYYDQNTSNFEPVAGLKFRAKVADYDPTVERNWYDIDGEFISDSNGYFEVTGLTQYRGKVVLYTDGYTTGQDRYQMEFYEDSGNETRANEIEIVNGNTVYLEMDWRLQPLQ